MDRRQYLGVAGASIVALLGGCSSSGSQSTATATDTPTGTPTETVTRTETATDTPTEEPTETATSTPKPENRSFQEIYDEAMAEADAGSVDDAVLNRVDTDDWSAGDLEQVAVSAAQSVGKENAMAVGKALYENFSSNPDELYVDSRRVSLGGGVDILKVFDQKNDEIHYMMPWAHVSDEGVFLKEGENPDTSTERNLAGLQDSGDIANFTALDPEQIESRIEYYGGKEEISDAKWRGAWSTFMNYIGDVIVGEKPESDDFAFTRGAVERIAEMEVDGYGGIGHIRGINENYSSLKGELGTEERIKIHYDGGWNFGITDSYDSDGFAEAP